jgi:hypothetical protein
VPSVFDKLNIKGHRQILVLDPPDSFENELESLQDVVVMRSLTGRKQVGFCLVFVTRKDQVDRVSKSLAAKATGDAVVWFAYPKGTSKKLKCDFNRDNGWEVIRAAGFDTVRQVAIDEDWSALRFRRVEFINRRS